MPAIRPRQLLVIFAWALLALLMLPPQQAQAIAPEYSTCEKVGTTCVDGPSTKCVPNGDGTCTNITRACWEYVDEYKCYSNTEVNSCEPSELAGCYLAARTNDTVVNGVPVKSTGYYICEEDWTPSCDQPAAEQFGNGEDSIDLSQFDCRQVSNTCVEGPETRTINGLPVYRDCWKKEVQWECYTGETTRSCTTDLSGCTVSGKTCAKEDPIDGRCIEWEERYICDEVEESCVEPPKPYGECSSEYTNDCTRYQDGQCVEWDTTRYCYTDPPAACDADPNCELVGTECEVWRGDVCEAQRQIYECEESETYCSEEQITQQCQDMTRGMALVENAPPSQGFGAAAAQLALLDEMQRTMDPENLTVFSGDVKKCSKPIGSSWLTNDCCQIDLDDEGSHLVSKCEQEEIDLAAARRAKRTHYVGRYCSESIDVGFDEICISRKYGYCAFPSVLTRLIQEQGRTQLADLAAGGSGGAKHGGLSFPAYNLSESEGAWSEPTTINGNTVRAWRWPLGCKSLERAAELDCPATFGEVWFAASADLVKTGAPPASPFEDTLWEITTRSGTATGSTAVSEYVVASGKCDGVSEQCNFDLSAWQAGSGGEANSTLSLPVSFALRAEPSGWSGAPAVLGNYGVRTYSYPIDAQPTSVKIDVTVNDGGLWETFELPLSISGAMTLPTSPEVVVSGACDSMSGQCEYVLTGPHMVTAKPWGSGEHPKCGGFTMAEISVLDFSAMNLNEWLSSEEFAAPDPGVLAERMGSDIENFYDAYESGQTTPRPSEQQLKVFMVDPTEGVGEFTVSLQAVGFWPDLETRDNRVNGLTIDWGDGTTSEGVRSGDLYRASHTYAKPAADKVEHPVVVYFDTEITGMKQAQATIVGYRNTPEPSTSGQGGGGTTDIYTYNPSRLPNDADGRSAPSLEVTPEGQ